MNALERQYSGEDSRAGSGRAPAADHGGFRKTARDGGSPEKAHVEFQIDEALHLALYRFTPTGILLSKSDGRIVAANPAACRMLGRTEEQLRKLTRLELIHPEEPRLPALKAERERTGNCQGELTLVRGDGSTFEAEMVSVVAANEAGSVTSMVIRDVSERKRTEARIHMQAQWLDRANEAIIVVDLNHRVTYWNQGAERMGGWKAAEVVGRSLDDVITSAGIFDPPLLAAARQMAEWRGTISCQQRNGTPQVLATSISILRDPRGQPAGRLCICTDITEQTQLKEKYERALRLRSIGMLATGLAHDLNNILTPIGLCVPMLRERLSHPEDIEMLEMVEACAARSAAIVRQVLAFAQGSGTEARAIQIKPILREVAGLVRETFPRAISLDTDIPSDLWPVMADATQIHQLLLNLCVNARDAMPQGGRLRLGGRNCILDEEAASRIEGARKGAWLVLHVEDTGTGIAPELLVRIWEPFFTTKSGGAGHGLGLSSVRSIVETHAGFVSVDTEAGRGTAFRVFLPAIASNTLRQEPELPRRNPSGGGERVLVVEDESAIRDVIGASLKRAGYRVATAANGAEALERFKTEPEQFDLVLTDRDMPEISGARLAWALAAIRPNLPVLAMSGLSSRSPEVNPEQFSGGFLQKPFTVDELLKAVRRAIDHAAVRAQYDDNGHGTTAATHPGPAAVSRPQP